MSKKQKLMGRSLTPQQRDVLAFIHEFSREEGMPPTRADIARHFGWKSANAAQTALCSMQRKGAIWLKPRISRGIVITEVSV